MTENESRSSGPRVLSASICSLRRFVPHMEVQSPRTVRPSAAEQVFEDFRHPGPTGPLEVYVRDAARARLVAQCPERFDRICVERDLAQVLHTIRCRNAVPVEQTVPERDPTDRLAARAAVRRAPHSEGARAPRSVQPNPRRNGRSAHAMWNPSTRGRSATNRLSASASSSRHRHRTANGSHGGVRASSTWVRMNAARSRFTVLVAPVGEDEPRRVLVGLRADGGQECVAVGHEISLACRRYTRTRSPIRALSSSFISADAGEPMRLSNTNPSVSGDSIIASMP